MDSYKNNNSNDLEIRQCRLRKKQTECCCPVCGITVRPNEIENHYAMEVDKLHKLSKTTTRKSLYSSSSSSTSIGGSSTITMTSNSGSGSNTAGQSTSDTAVTMNDGESSWGTFQKIKNNRQLRLKVSII